MSVKIQRGGKRKFGYFNESELKMSYHPSETPPTEHLVDGDLIVAANYLREMFGSALKINSLGRTPKYNGTLDGSATKSFHLMFQGRPIKAMDLSPVNGNIIALKRAVIQNMPALKSIGIRGVGFYPTFVHIDTGDRGDGGTYTWGTSTAENLAIVGAKPVLEISKMMKIINSFSSTNMLGVLTAGGYFVKGLFS